MGTFEALLKRYGIPYGRGRKELKEGRDATLLALTLTEAWELLHPEGKVGVFLRSSIPGKNAKASGRRPKTLARPQHPAQAGRTLSFRGENKPSESAPATLSQPRRAPLWRKGCCLSISVKAEKETHRPRPRPPRRNGPAHPERDLREGQWKRKKRKTSYPTHWA